MDQTTFNRIRDRFQNRIDTHMWHEVRERAERQIYREHDREIRKALHSRSASEYIGETK